MSLDQREREETQPSTRASIPKRPVPALRLVALGMLLLQLAWVFVIPPFGGMDEFDHAYRAASVARGQWFATPTDATRGTGAWLQVPVDIVKAARPECMPLPYTGVSDCVGWWHGNTARIASGAGRYNPLFYAVIGIPALPFTGDSALYAMRIMTVLLSWALFCLGLAATRFWARGAWPYIGIAIASTPVLIYSSSIVAPNGPEMMAALALWCALIGLLQRNRSGGFLFVVTAVSGGLLVTMRSLGPLWCLLSLATTLLAARPPRAWWWHMAHSWRAWLTAGSIFVSTLLSAWWILAMRSLEIGGGPREPAALLEKMTFASQQAILWILQSIAAFPFRNEQTLPVVYVCYFFLFMALLIYGFRLAKPQLRLALLLSLFLSVAIPFALTVITYDSTAGDWQGRYGLPYALGVVILAGSALDRAPVQLDGHIAFASMCLFVVAQSVGPVYVLLQELAESPLSGTPAWPNPYPLAIAMTAGCGAALMWYGACRARGRMSAND